MSKDIDVTSLAKVLVDKLGGFDNLDNVGYCATRLRVTLKDYDKVDLKDVETVDGVIGVKKLGNQIQIVIGPKAKNVSEQINSSDGYPQEKKANASSKKVKTSDKIFNYITHCITPIFYGFIASGLIKAVITLLETFKLIDATSPIYAIFTAAGNAIFFFLPVFVAYTASKYLKSNTVVMMIIALTFLDTNYTALLSNESINSFFQVTYSSQFIPVLLAAPIAAWIEKSLADRLPKTVASLLNPLITVLVSVCAIYYVIGPLGSLLGVLAMKATTSLNDVSSVLTGAFVAGISGYLVIFGAHLAFVPLIIQNMANLGYDPILAYMNIASWVQVAIALGVTLALKSKEEKSEGLAVVFSGAVSGITEPALFGYAVKNKSTLIILGVAGLIGGAVAGFFKSYFVSFVGGMVGWISNWSPVFPYHLLALAVACTVAAVASYIVTKRSQK